LKIGIGNLDEFEEEVFQVHFVMGLSEAETRGRLQGASTGRV
jgi:hypothetical protein